jgi:hypothetical protein
MSEISRAVETLAREIGATTARIEDREAALKELTAREAGLRSDVQHWQTRAADLSKQLTHGASLENSLRAEQEQLQKELDRLRGVEQDHATENQALASRIAANTREAASLRQLVSELQASLSWKITAPLRWVSGPLFRMLAPKRPTTPESIRAVAEPVESILPELRRAQSIAVIPCAIPFSSTLNQRPISWARYLADHGTTVLYVAWQWSPDEAVPQAGEEVYPRVFQIPLYAFQDNVNTLATASSAKSSYLSTIPSARLVEVSKTLRAAGWHVHYDIMDDWEEFHRGGEAPWFTAALEREMVVVADTVSVVSPKLAEKFGHLRSDIAVVRNGYQPSALACEQFLAARSPLEHPKTIGYFGHLTDAWFDWDTVCFAAQQRPDVEFELIGWAVSDSTRMRVSAIPNIRLVGIVPQPELHLYARKWWGAMIPFRPSILSEAVDPLKIYEYLHFGLPTIVTGIPGIAAYPLVHFTDSPEGFVSALDRFDARPDERTLAEISEFLTACVWDERFRVLSSSLHSGLDTN